MAPLPGCPPPAPTPAFRRRFGRTPLAAEQLLEYRSRSLSERVFRGYPVLKINIGLSEREILALVVHMIRSIALCNEASRHLHITWIAGVEFIPPNPPPCQAWHGCRVTIAHHEEVGVSADGHANMTHPPQGPPPLRRRRVTRCFVPSSYVYYVVAYYRYNVFA
jgi:hypothetical protein